MSEKTTGLYERLSHPHTGDLRVDPQSRKTREQSTVKPFVRRKPGIAAEDPGLFDKPVDEVFQYESQNSGSGEEEKNKERKRRIHPYNIPKGTKTWSGPYGKDGTMQLEDVPADVLAYPVYKRAYSGALTVMMEVESPPELQGKRFQVAKPLKAKGWYR